MVKEDKRKKMDDTYVQYTPKQIADAEKQIEKLISQNQAEVYKEYLTGISGNYSVESPSKASTSVVCFDITKFIIDEKDIVTDKLKNVYHMLAYSDCSLALIVSRQKEGCSISFAVGCEGQEESYNQAQRIEDALLGNFPGTNASVPNSCAFHKSYSIFKPEVFNNINAQNYFSVATVANVATEYSEDFVNQGIEKLIDGIVPCKPDKTDEYTFVLLAKPLSAEAFQYKKDFLCGLYQSLSPFAKRQMNWGKTEAENWSSNWSVGINGNMGLPNLHNFGTKKLPNFLGMQLGFNAGGGHAWGGSVSVNGGESVEVTNYNIQHTLEILEKQMQRLDTCSALGMWDFAGYVFSRNFEMTEKVARMYLSLTQGNESYYEQPAVNSWNGTSNGENGRRNDIKKIMESVAHLEHPLFIKNNNAPKHWLEKVCATVTISGSELAYALNLPRKSVPGCAVIQSAAFGREITSYNNLQDNGLKLNIGNIHHMHNDEEKTVDLDMNSLSSHVFVTGSTGSGKSNTVYQLLNEAKKNGVKFLVVEPAKGEYKYVFGDDVKVYGTNPALGSILKLNPFAFPSEIHIFEHIDRILDVFNVCWPMYAAMPAVLKDAIIKAYEVCGWDFVTSCGNSFPTFKDVLAQIDVVMNSSDYSDENKGNYKGALKTRIESLCNGINGLMFCNGETDNESLFEENVIVDLSRIGSSDTKALIMGLFVIKLQEYRMTRGGINLPLKHITVLEEAHNLLKRASDNGPEGNNVAAKSVEMFANAIAEMRTYGESFVIVDQSPGLMDMSVIRNTNTKIIMRLPDMSDRELVGKAASLNDAQIVELARLQKGVAAIYQNDWIEAVLCKVKHYKRNLTPKGEIPEGQRIGMYSAIASSIYNPRLLDDEKTSFVKTIDSLELSEKVRDALLEYYYNRTPAAQANAAKLFLELDNVISELKDKVKKGENVIVDNIIMREMNNKPELFRLHTDLLRDLRLRDEFCHAIKVQYHLFGTGEENIL